MRELQSIVDYERFLPSIDPIFDTGCTPGCSVLTCSCTAIDPYWSATSDAGFPLDAWGVHFARGTADPFAKVDLYLVRAVRGSL